MWKLLAVVVLAGCTDNTPPPAWTQRGVLPLRLEPSGTHGGVRFAAMVQIGTAAPIEAMIDTGSSGLRVKRGAVPDSAFTDITSEPVVESFHSGLVVTGVVAHAPVSIAGDTTPDAIPIQRIDTVGCKPSVPDCGADDALFGGYDVIVGIGMRMSTAAGGVGNPIAQLAGHPAYVVRAPSDGSDLGDLEIAADLAGHTMQMAALGSGAPLPDGTPTWDDRTVPVCVDSFCGGALLDTGCEPIELESMGYTSDATWATGTALDVSIDSGALGFHTVVGDEPRDGIDRVIDEPRTVTPNLINLGTTAFFHYDVRFDQAAGTITLAER